MPSRFTRIASGAALVAFTTGCGVSQAKVGACLAWGGLMGSTIGVTAAIKHCSPDASYCKDVVPGNSAGVPLIAFGALAFVTGVVLVATSHDKNNSSRHASVAGAGPIITNPQ